MSSSTGTLESKLLVLKQRFMAGLPLRFDALAALLEQGAANAEAVDMEQIERCFHTLAGTAGTYGEMRIAALAAEGEEVCASAAAETGASLIEYLSSLLEAIRLAAEPGCPRNDDAETQDPFGPSIQRAMLAQADTELRLHGTGWSATAPPVAPTVLAIAESASPGEAANGEPRESTGKDPARFDERPRLIRYPAAIKPADPSTSRLTEATVPPKDADETLGTGRVLCVEDDPDQSRHIETILQDAGYVVMSIGDAASFHPTLATFQPDLILMDIGLPEFTGMDLAKYVREDPANATLPIVFLTGDRRIASRIDALGVGGDDYLIKPVSGELLLSVVGARLERSRSLRAMIDRDGLTGVLNHAALMRRADIMGSEARRRREEVALVMLDLDHFKSVNDRYGHIAGDRVLTTFAAFLKENLRAGDEVGRYGGEEFALLLRNLSAGDAQTLVARLIDDFGDTVHRAPDGSAFKVTFSAGVAMYESGYDLELWKRRADEALYSAKHLGRARVEAA